MHSSAAFLDFSCWSGYWIYDDEHLHSQIYHFIIVEMNRKSENLFHGPTCTVVAFTAQIYIEHNYKRWSPIGSASV